MMFLFGSSELVSNFNTPHPISSHEKIITSWTRRCSTMLTETDSWSRFLVDTMNSFYTKFMPSIVTVGACVRSVKGWPKFGVLSILEHKKSRSLNNIFLFCWESAKVDVSASRKVIEHMRTIWPPACNMKLPWWELQKHSEYNFNQLLSLEQHGRILCDNTQWLEPTDQRLNGPYPSTRDSWNATLGIIFSNFIHE